MPNRPRSAADIDIGDTFFSLTRRTDLPGLARPAPSAKKTRGATDMTLMQVGLDDKYRLDQAASTSPASRRWCGCRCCSANATARRAQHRGLHLGLSRLAARRCTTTRCGAPRTFLQAHDIAFDPGAQRGPRRHRGVGQPAGRAVRRARRSMACSASGTARAPASTAPATRSSTPTSPASRATAACWCVAGDDHGCQSSTWRIRATCVFHGGDADAQPGDGAGISRFRPPRLRAVALFRLLGRLQGDHRDGRELGLGLRRSRARA